MAFHPSAPYLATGSEDRTAKLCNFEKIVEEVIRAPHVICSHITDPNACKRAQRQALLMMRMVTTPHFSLPLRKRLELLVKTPSFITKRWGRRHSFVVSLLAKRLSEAHADDLSGDPGIIQRRHKKFPLLENGKKENRGGGRKSRKSRKSPKKNSSRQVKRIYRKKMLPPQNQKNKTSKRWK